MILANYILFLIFFSHFYGNVSLVSKLVRVKQVLYSSEICDFLRVLLIVLVNFLCFLLLLFAKFLGGIFGREGNISEYRQPFPFAKNTLKRILELFWLYFDWLTFILIKLLVWRAHITARFWFWLKNFSFKKLCILKESLRVLYLFIMTLWTITFLFWV